MNRGLVFVSWAVSWTLLAACQGDIVGGRNGFAPGASGAGAGAVGSGAAGANGFNGGSTAGTAGSGAAGAPVGQPACGAGVIPPAVAAVISGKCVACHGSPPVQGVPTSLTTYAQLAAPSMTDPTKSVAALALARMQDTAKPMPPPPLAAATAADVMAFQAWVAGGLSSPACADGGAGADAGGAIVDPFSVAPVCTSKTTWTGGNRESPLMNPGTACISCHTMMNQGPALAIAGTVFPTAHEPDLCNGGNVTTGARVVIKGANGQTVTLTPNAAGNFQYEGALAKPYTAKVTYMGRERIMLASQTSGDCNSCHTQAGAMNAPGRILLP